jgi:hypothetical protein
MRAISIRRKKHPIVLLVTEIAAPFNPIAGSGQKISKAPKSMKNI